MSVKKREKALFEITVIDCMYIQMIVLLLVFLVCTSSAPYDTSLYQYLSNNIQTSKCCTRQNAYITSLAKSKKVPGWYYEEVYSDSCNVPNKVLKNYGVLTNTCINYNSSSGSLSYSISCGKDVANIFLYAKVNCKQFNFITRKSFPMNTCINASSSFVSRSIRSGCTSEISPLPIRAGNWYQIISTDSPTCEKTLTYKAIANGTCIDFSSKQGSERYDFPVHKVFLANHCDPEQLLYADIYSADRCNASPDNYDWLRPSDAFPDSSNSSQLTNETYSDDAYTYSANENDQENPGSNNMTSMLAYQKVHFLTVLTNPILPGIIDTAVRYSIAQTLQNINAMTFQAAYTVNARVFRETVASIMIDVDWENVNITSVKDVSSSTSNQATIFVDTPVQRKEEVHRVMRGVSTMTIAACVILYTIHLPSYAAAGYANPQEAYNHTLSLLTASLATNQFSTQLQSYATQQNATQLTSVTSTATSLRIGNYSIGNQPAPSLPGHSTSTNTKESSTSSSPFSTSLVIVVICVGSILLLACCLGVMWYMMRMKGKWKIYAIL